MSVLSKMFYKKVFKKVLGNTFTLSKDYRHQKIHLQLYHNTIL